MTQMFRPSSDAFVCPACDEDMQLTAVIPPVGVKTDAEIYQLVKTLDLRDRH